MFLSFEKSVLVDVILNFLIFVLSKIINKVLVTKTAVNIEHTIPMLRVIANPLIGPEPIFANTKAAIRVVMLASKIVMNALLYPDCIPDKISFPILSSSDMARFTRYLHCFRHPSKTFIKHTVMFGIEPQKQHFRQIGRAHE